MSTSSAIMSKGVDTEEDMDSCNNKDGAITENSSENVEGSVSNHVCETPKPGHHDVVQLSRQPSSGIEMSPVRDKKTFQRKKLNRHSKNSIDERENVDEKPNGPSNECLLGTAFVTFMGFALLETGAAFVAGSEALMGDSAAMIVDALTYLFNLLAERKKKRFTHDHALPLTASIYPERARRVFRRDRRKMTLQLELVPPLISVTVLIIVTGVVLNQAIRVLILDAHRERSEQSDPNLNLMLGFSVVNLVLDILNVFCFAKAKHLCGYETIERNHAHPPSLNGDEAQALSHQNLSFGDRSTRNSEYVKIDTSEGSEEDFVDDEIHVMTNGLSHRPPQSENKLVNKEGKSQLGSSPSNVAAPDYFGAHPNNNVDNDNGEVAGQTQSNGLDRCNGELPLEESLNQCSVGGATSPEEENKHLDKTSSHSRQEASEEGDLDDEQGHANLNMCSAYTHVFADTLRSIAVTVASSIAEVCDEVTSEEADAMAAVVVSALILLSLIPLFQGWLHSYKELRAIQAEERSEAFF